MRNTAKLCWYGTLLIIIAQAVFAYADLPDRMATHFDFTGEADGFMDKDPFYIFWFVIVGLINIWVPLLPRLILKWPQSLVSLPNKEYWFANETRRTEMVGRVVEMSAWISVLVNGMFFLMFHGTIQYNVDGEPFSVGWSMAGIILILVVFSIVYPFIALKKPE